MLNVNDLENRWLKYKIKSYIPHATILVSVFAIAIISIIFINFENDTKKQTQSDMKKDVKTNAIKLEKKVETLHAKAEKIEQKTKKVEQKIEIEHKIETAKQNPKKPYKKEMVHKKEKLVLAPSMDFMKYMQENTPAYYDDADTEDAVVFRKKAPEKKEIKKHKQIVKKEPVIVKIQKNKSVITINKENTLQDIQEVIKRFKINNNPALSLFVAKKYYELGLYNKSYNYALITNEINSNIEASWIIFAKSLVKLNEKEMAIKTLKKYIKHTNSNNAKILLNNIQSGKFK